MRSYKLRISLVSSDKTVLSATCCFADKCRESQKKEGGKERDRERETERKSNSGEGETSLVGLRISWPPRDKNISFDAQTFIRLHV